MVRIHQRAPYPPHLSMRLRPVATACGLAGIALLLFLFRLSALPLSQAESDFNTQAQSIANDHTPLFFHVREQQWLQPAAPYANAAIRAVGGDDVSGRLASAVAAAISVALLFLIAHEITGPWWANILASVTLMLTPAFWSFAQRGTDAIVPVPLLLLWLLNVLRFLKGDALRTLALAAAMLGISTYTHPAAPLTAVFLWVLTLVVARRRNPARLMAATVVFGAAWLPAAVWFLRHADTYPDTFGRWFVFAPHVRTPLDGLRAFFNPGTLGNRASAYWGFWDPAWLVHQHARVTCAAVADRGAPDRPGAASRHASHHPRCGNSAYRRGVARAAGRRDVRPASLSLGRDGSDADRGAVFGARRTGTGQPSDTARSPYLSIRRYRARRLMPSRRAASDLLPPALSSAARTWSEVGGGPDGSPSATGTITPRRLLNERSRSPSVSKY